MRKTLLIVLMLLIVCWLASGVTQVQPGERVLVRRFGQFVARVGPGLRVGWPYPIETIDRVALDRVRRLVVGYQPDRDEEELVSSPGQLLTGDQNLINVQVLIDYTVQENRVEEYVLQGERIEEFLSRAAEACLADWISGRSVDDVLLRGKLELPSHLVRRLQGVTTAYDLGVVVQGGSVSFLYPPAEVKMAFDEVNRAQTAIRTREHEARQAAERRRLEAEAEKNRLEKQALAYAVEQKALAYADVRRFEQRLDQYRRLAAGHPGFLATIWWEEIGALLARLKESGRLDLLDHRLGSDGLDITIAPGSGVRGKP